MRCFVTLPHSRSDSRGNSRPVGPRLMDQRGVWIFAALGFIETRFQDRTSNMSHPVEVLGQSFATISNFLVLFQRQYIFPGL